MPTLAAIAAHASGPAPVAAVLDARRGEVYAAGFEGGRAADWLAEGVIPIAALAARLPAGCRVVGDGAALCADALRGADAVLVPPPYPGDHRAPRRADRGARVAAAASAIPASELVPRYLRRAEAEVKRTGLRYEPF